MQPIQIGDPAARHQQQNARGGHGDPGDGRSADALPQEQESTASASGVTEMIHPRLLAVVVMSPAACIRKCSVMMAPPAMSGATSARSNRSGTRFTRRRRPRNGRPIASRIAMIATGPSSARRIFVNTKVQPHMITAQRRSRWGSMNGAAYYGLHSDGHVAVTNTDNQTAARGRDTGCQES